MFVTEEMVVDEGVGTEQDFSVEGRVAQIGNGEKKRAEDGTSNDALILLTKLPVFTCVRLLRSRFGNAR